MLTDKLKGFEKILPKIKQDLDFIAQVLTQNNYRKGNYNLHFVPVNGVEYLVADAKSINKYDHQSGRGCWRYLFDKLTRQYVGLAKEKDNGQYKFVA